MFKKTILVIFLLFSSFQSMADVTVNSLYKGIENKNFDKPYTQFIEPLSKIIGTDGPLTIEKGSVDSFDNAIHLLNTFENDTGLTLANLYETPISQKRKITQLEFKTNGNSRKSAYNYTVSFFVVDDTVEKIILNVQSKYGDKYSLISGLNSRACLFCINEKPEEAMDTLKYFKTKMTSSGWVLDNSITSHFSGNYVFTKGDIELVARESRFYPLEIDIKRKDLAAERDVFDDLEKLGLEMSIRRVDETRKQRYEN